MENESKVDVAKVDVGEKDKELIDFKYPNNRYKIDEFENYVPNDETWTITFGECVENHAGMQMVGSKSNTGFTVDELKTAYELAVENGFDCELIDLNESLPEGEKGENACILIVREGVTMFLEDEADKFKHEVYATKNVVDTKAFMKGRVVNKKARYNLCYAEKSQVPDYENKKGTILSFNQVPYLNKIREKLPSLLGEKGKGLLAELNYYYDIKKCYIGYHGDTERSRVVGFRIGSDFSLKFNWYKNTNPIGKKIEVILKDGDFYVMS